MPDDETRTLEQAALRGRAPARRREPRRRLSRDAGGSAGHALIVCVLALAIGLLLNAPGTHKSAYNKPDGWQRDVALAVTGPLATVSHALLLDRPRKGVQALIGRSGIDEIDTEIAAARGGFAAPRRSPPPEEGGVLAGPQASGLGRRRLARRRPRLRDRASRRGEPRDRVVGGVDGRVATGLTRPDVFNWFEEIPLAGEGAPPRVVVLGFGANDDKTYMTGRRRASRSTLRRVDVAPRVRAPGGRPPWTGSTARVRSSSGSASRRRGSPEQTQRFDVVNAVVQRQARMREGRTAFVDTYTTFAGDDGGYAQYLSNPRRAGSSRCVPTTASTSSPRAAT